MTKTKTKTQTKAHAAARRSPAARPARTLAPKLVVAPRPSDAASTYAVFDGLTGAIMVANRDSRITYMNRAARELFAGYNDVFARTFPGFDSTRLVGESFDRFHRHPAHQRGLL